MVIARYRKTVIARLWIHVLPSPDGFLEER